MSSGQRDPAGAEHDDRAARLIAAASRALAAGGLADLIWGHVSIRDREGRGLWIKRFGPSLAEVTPDDVVLISLAGEILAGQGAPPLEWPLHAETLASRPEVHSVAHVHSPAVNALTATGHPIRPVSHEGTLFAFPDVPIFTDTSNLITTAELGTRLAETLGGARACLMPGHGAMTVGRDIAEAVVTAVLLDRACATQVAALATGLALSWSTPAETAEKRVLLANAKQFDATFSLLQRQAGGPEG